MSGTPNPFSHHPWMSWCSFELFDLYAFCFWFYRDVCASTEFRYALLHHYNPGLLFDWSFFSRLTWSIQVSFMSFLCDILERNESSELHIASSCMFLPFLCLHCLYGVVLWCLVLHPSNWIRIIALPGINLSFCMVSTVIDCNGKFIKYHIRYTEKWNIYLPTVTVHIRY